MILSEVVIHAILGFHLEEISAKVVIRGSGARPDSPNTTTQSLLCLDSVSEARATQFRDSAMPRLRKSTNLSLQRLDDRITPAVNVSLLPSGVLNVTGFPTDVLTVEQTGPNKLMVTDGAKS